MKKALLPSPSFPLAAAMGVASQIPVVEGGPAGSGVVEATIRSATE